MQQRERLSQSTKAIHPITTAILIVALIITIAGITYIWITIQNRAGNSVQIQSVAFQASVTKIYVQNIGQGTVIIETVHINGEQYQINPTNCTVTSENTTTIKQGSTAELTVDRHYSDTVKIKVTCKDGSSYESNYKP